MFCCPAYEIVVHSEWCAVNGSNWSVLFRMAGLVPWWRGTPRCINTLAANLFLWSDSSKRSRSSMLIQLKMSHGNTLVDLATCSWWPASVEFWRHLVPNPLFFQRCAEIRLFEKSTKFQHIELGWRCGQAALTVGSVPFQKKILKRTKMKLTH